MNVCSSRQFLFSFRAQATGNLLERVFLLKDREYIIRLPLNEVFRLADDVELMLLDANQYAFPTQTLASCIFSSLPIAYQLVHCHFSAIISSARCSYE